MKDLYVWVFSIMLVTILIIFYYINNDGPIWLWK